MKMHKFTLGAIAGITTIGLAIPALAQVSSAATSADTIAKHSFVRPIPTQEQVQEMVTRDDAFLQSIDAFVTVQKSATQVHRDALIAAAAITDDTARQEAVEKANTDKRAAMEAFITEHPELKPPMMRGGRGHGFGMKGGRMHEDDGDDKEFNRAGPRGRQSTPAAQ